jgi:hypothetical protein
VNRIIVFPRSDGRWNIKISGAAKASSSHSTQDDAYRAAVEMLKQSGGGQLILDVPAGVTKLKFRSVKKRSRAKPRNFHGSCDAIRDTFPPPPKPKK